MSNYITDKKRKNTNTTLNPQLYKLIKSISLNKECYINTLIEEGMLQVIEKYKKHIPNEMYDNELKEYAKLKKKLK